MCLTKESIRARTLEPEEYTRGVQRRLYLILKIIRLEKEGKRLRGELGRRMEEGRLEFEWEIVDKGTGEREMGGGVGGLGGEGGKVFRRMRREMGR